MSVYYIQTVAITNLWGYRNIHIDFNKDVNIIIGPNASGKTTILNLLRYIFTADISNLRNIEFEKVDISLKSFDEESTRTIRVSMNDTGYKFTVSRNTYDVELEPFFHAESRSRVLSPRLAARLRFRYADLEQAMKELVHAVWLPVSRRLPITEDEEIRPTSTHLESVDVRLRELIKELQTYRLRLESKLSVEYKSFEKSVLREILYSKEYDQLGSLSSREMPEAEDKEQLLRAFQVAGLLDTSMQKRINEHFAAAEDAIRKFETYSEKKEKDEVGFPIDFLFIMPLIRRTKSIIQYARKLEEDRNELFEPINKFETIVNSFLQPKTIAIEDNGDLIIRSPVQEKIAPHMLSSGEKQILILLIQALVWEDQPVIYVADEPELSLHVSWQEKLLKSLIELTKQIQIIVATHSPDIVGPYIENVIDLGAEQ